MIIDLILDRKEEDEAREAGRVAYSDCKQDFFRPAREVADVAGFELPEGLEDKYLYQYNPWDMYARVMEYESLFEMPRDISFAMDYGTEEDVKAALVQYMLDQGYDNPENIDYVNSVNWIDGWEY